jgi:hypothetical protein
MSPFTRKAIPLNGDRSDGALFQDVRGKFLLVEQCDMPCEISLDGGATYFPAKEGIDIRGEFDSLFLRHGNYINSTQEGGVDDNTSPGLPAIKFLYSSTSAINNYFDRQTSSRSGLPFVNNGISLIVFTGRTVKVIRRAIITLRLLDVGLGVPDAQNTPYIHMSKPKVRISFWRDFYNNNGRLLQGMDIASIPSPTNTFQHNDGSGIKFNLFGEYVLTNIGPSYSGYAHFNLSDIVVPHDCEHVLFTFDDDGTGMVTYLGWDTFASDGDSTAYFAGE